jgi:hypothetical protein
MTDVQQQLRSTSDALLQDLEVLITLEQEKRDLPVDDERMVALAARIDEIAVRVMEHARRERDLAGPLHEAAQAGLASSDPIEQAVPRATSVILADWRAAERQAQEADDGSPEQMEAEARIDLLRLEYRRAYETIRATGEGTDRGA